VVLALISALLSGCGGGGGPRPGSILDQRTVIVSPQQDQTVQLGEAKVTIQKGTFNASIPVTVSQLVPYQPAQPNFQPVYSGLSISCPDTPQRTITATYSMPTGAQGLLAVAYENGQPIGAFPVTTSSGEARVLIEPSMVTKSRGGVLVTLMLGVLGVVNSPDNETNLVLIAGSGRGRTLIFVHGLLQGAADMQETAMVAKNLGGYESVYVLRYDYRRPFADVGAELANLLSFHLFSDPKQVDLVGYSKGGLVVRHCLEAMGQTKPVRRAILLACPNTGCRISLAALYGTLALDYLSSKKALPFLNWGESCLDELMPGSNQLNSLNTFQHHQNGDVDYWLFAGDTDTVVSQSSAWGTGTPIDDFTNGVLWRKLLTQTGHLSADSTGAIKQVYAALTSTQTNGLQISYDSNPLEASGWWGSWTSTETIVNSTGQRITIESLLTEMYDRQGQWWGNYWYDPYCPPGEFFPHERADWGLILDPSESETLSLGYYPDEDGTPLSSAPANKQALTAHQTVLATGEDGTIYKTSKDLLLTYNGASPAPPHTRKGKVAFGKPLAIRRLR